MVLKPFLEEVKARVARGEGYYEKGAPRIAIFFPSFAYPIFNQFIGQLGLAPILAEPMWWPPDAALVPDLGVEKEMNPYRVMAKAMLKITQIGPFHIRVGAVQKGVKRYNLDGFFGLFPYSCRPFVSDALVLKDAMKKAMDIPVMVIEGDQWDARRYNVESLRTRMESFAEMCKISKMRKDIAAAA